LRSIDGLDLLLGPSTAFAAWRGSSPDPEMQAHPATLQLHLVDLALAIVLAAGLRSQQFGVSREPPSVATAPCWSVLSPERMAVAGQLQ
jgi:hypothetical protein